MRTVFLMFIFVSTLTAQEFTPSTKWLGEVRVRSEFDWRDFNKSTPMNTYTLLRTRLGFEAIPIENVRVYIQAQDSRTFGQEKDATGFNTLSDGKNIDLHQGYLEAKKVFWDELSFRLGRMELSYGNERIIGAASWHNVGRSFDGGLLRFDFENVSFDFFAMNTGEVQSYAPTATPLAVKYTKDWGQDFYGTYAALKSIKGHKLDGYFLYQWNRRLSVTGEDSLKRFTLGLYAKGGLNDFDYTTEVAFQGGKLSSADVSAFLLAVTVGYSFKEMSLTNVAIGYEYLSGTAANDAKYKSFDPMFHSGHKFYGFMDYFISIPANTEGRGLTDAFARASFKYSDKIGMNFWVHHFAHAQDVNGERALGQELDLTAQYRYNSVLSFDIGVSAFLPGIMMRQRFGDSDIAFWGYLTTTVTF